MSSQVPYSELVTYTRRPSRKMSATSYCLSSPVPQQDTYSQRSSTDRSRSLISGGTAPKGLRAGGSRSGSAGSAGTVMTLRTAQRSPSRYQAQMDPDRSSTLITTPTNPPGLGRVPAVGSLLQPTTLP